MKKLYAALMVSSLMVLAGLVVAAPTGVVARGSQIYSQNCMGCHAAAGAGSTVGPALAGKKSDVPGWSFAVFKRALMQGLDDAGKQLKAPMPLWSKTNLRSTSKPPTDQNIADLLAYLKSIR